MKRAVRASSIGFFLVVFAFCSIGLAGEPGMQTVFVDQLTNGILDPIFPCWGRCVTGDTSSPTLRRAAGVR